MSRIAAIFAACVLTLPACSESKRPPAEPAPVAAVPIAPAPPVTQAPAPVAPAPPATAEPTPDDLPLPEDFVAEATRQITAKNFRAELDKIEKDLDAEK